VILLLLEKGEGKSDAARLGPLTSRTFSLRFCMRRGRKPHLSTKRRQLLLNGAGASWKELARLRHRLARDASRICRHVAAESLLFFSMAATFRNELRHREDGAAIVAARSSTDDDRGVRGWVGHGVSIPASPEENRGSPGLFVPWPAPAKGLLSAVR